MDNVLFRGVPQMTAQEALDFAHNQILDSVEFILVTAHPKPGDEDGAHVGIFCSNPGWLPWFTEILQRHCSESANSDH